HRLAGARHTPAVDKCSAPARHRRSALQADSPERLSAHRNSREAASIARTGLAAEDRNIAVARQECRAAPAPFARARWTDRAKPRTVMLRARRPGVPPEPAQRLGCRARRYRSVEAARPLEAP